jgi:hypothetical protein
MHNVSINSQLVSPAHDRAALARALRDEPVSPVDLQRTNQFAAVAKKFVAATASKKALIEAWQELPDHLQRRAVTIAADHGIDRYFTALVGQVPDAMTG